MADEEPSIGEATGVRHRSWPTKFWQQYLALLWKNALLSKRQLRATLLRVGAPFFFMLLVWMIDKAVKADERNVSALRVVRDPEAKSVGSIPKCEADLYSQSGCVDFSYTVAVLDNSTSEELALEQAGMIVDRIRENNEPPVAADRVLLFKDRNEQDEWFLENPEKSLGAVHFFFWDEGKRIDFTLQTNSSIKVFKGKFQDPNFFFQLPMQVAVEREIVRQHLLNLERNDEARDLKWDVGYSEFPHPAFQSLSVVGVTLGPFLFAANMFGFVSQVTAMVQEKQYGMRQALKTVGMLDSAYWLSWATWEIFVILIMTFLNMAFGALFQFKFFLKNAFSLVFALLFLFQLSMSGMGMVLSVILPNTTWATIFGFGKFIIGWIMQVVVIAGIPFTAKYYKYLNSILTIIFSLVPSNLFMKGVSDLGEATSSNESSGLDWSERNSYCRKVRGSVGCREEKNRLGDKFIICNCVLPLGELYAVFFLLYVGYFLLAVYLEHIIPNGMGVKNPPWYIFDPKYWGFKGKKQKKLKNFKYQEIGTGTVDEDVAQERKKLVDRTDNSGDSPGSADPAVEVYGLQKRFGKFWSIKGSWFTIEKSQLFCLLGPNGAGKTTTINCLTGVMSPTGGDALVYGESIVGAGGMEKIRAMMGVCPQFDVLWKELSGKEHLQIFGHVKGLPPKLVTAEADALLEKVKLTPAARQRSRTYSGGMKRRLSVAIALLGDPQIVYLDEPTTGMDPISRRYVWDIIESAKAGRAIVLTTHSMEEADILGDHISIMARGKIQAIGTSIRLKQKYGAGYEVSVAVGNTNNNKSASSPDLQDVQRKEQAVKDFFHASLSLAPKEENGAYLTYLIPRNLENDLPGFLKDLEVRQAELGITDIQLSLTTLEEVFLKIAKDAEVEAHKELGVSYVNIQFSDGRLVPVELGQDEVLLPDWNVKFQIQWGQDESGKLMMTDAVPLNQVPNAPVPSLFLM